jgi:hypothetical protein
MKIDDDHFYRGAALIQVAEHPNFTAINEFKKRKRKFPNAYKINEDIVIYCKYCKRPTGKYKEYTFTFTPENLDDLKNIDNIINKLFVVFVCVRARHICIIKYASLMELINIRKKAIGREENIYTIVIKLPKGKSFRVNMNQPGRKKIYLTEPLIVSRNLFPKILFD